MEAAFFSNSNRSRTLKLGDRRDVPGANLRPQYSFTRISDRLQRGFTHSLLIT